MGLSREPYGCVHLHDSACLLISENILQLFGFLGSWSSGFSSKWQHWKLLSGGYFTGSACMYNGNDLMLQVCGEAILVVTIPIECLRIPWRPKCSWQRHFKRRTLWVELQIGGIRYWVQTKTTSSIIISKLGGDPKATIWGESAGACYCDWISLSNFNHKVLHSMEIHHLRSSVQL